MNLTLANQKAIDYACKNFHYAKNVPIVQCAFNVYNNKKEWCGIIAYGTGNTPKIAHHFGLSQGEVIELVRVALNGKQEITSKAISLSLKLLKKHNPLIKLVVSYADTKQKHIGTIYQATNWIYEGESPSSRLIEYKGKLYHSRTYNKHKRQNTTLWKELQQALQKGKATLLPAYKKYKYIYPLDKKIKITNKPYPKKSGSSTTQSTTPFQGEDEGSNPILPHQ